ncbi:MAG: DsbA family protein [Candidatus Rokuibacteriota bacterium]
MRKIVLLLVGTLALWAAAVSAQPPPTTPPEQEAIKSDLEAIKSDLEDVKRQLGQILRLMQPRSAQAPAAPPSRARASVADAPTLGRPDAPVTLVEFSDYQCPFCQRFFLATLPALKRDYIDTGKVRYVFRDYPLDQIHPQARKAAEAAHCAGDQGKYWEMHDLLFRNQQALAMPQLGEHARALGLQVSAFDACLASGKYAARVSKGLEDGLAAGIQGTPGFVVGKTEPGASVEGATVRGAQPADVFRRLIDQLLVGM